jgi:hypothetical protein
MKCSKCGNEIAKGVTFCTKCLTAVEQNPTVESETPQNPQQQLGPNINAGQSPYLQTVEEPTGSLYSYPRAAKPLAAQQEQQNPPPAIIPSPTETVPIITSQTPVLPPTPATVTVTNSTNATAPVETPPQNSRQSAAPANDNGNVQINVNAGTPPLRHMPILRSALKYYLLSFITFGIYGVWFKARIGDDLGVIAGRYDGKRTTSYWLAWFLLIPLTFGIYYLVWHHKLSKRIGRELRRRGHVSTFGAGTFWLWNVLGSCILVGPFIYMHKLCHTMNRLSRDYNQFG